MPEKILYYLGAGASAQTLPLAKTVYKSDTTEPLIKIPGLAHELRSFDFTDLIQKSQKCTGIYTDLLITMSKEFKSLADKADVFGDVDTYAKFLKINQPRDDEFNRLKKNLSQYFCLKQVLNGALDKRYLPWLVSIMDSHQFPNNVKILSWNYDYQVQLAFSNFYPPEEIKHSGASFTHSPSGLLHLPTLDPTFSGFRLLSLIQLNGIAGYAYIQDRLSESIFQVKYKQNTESILKFLSENNLSDYFHFAWEGSQYHTNLMKHVDTMIDYTTILVVIGYSFPFFNRNVDKEVFKKLLMNQQLTKIYYQDPILDGQQLRAQFNLPDKIKITHIKQTDNFHIPFEY